MTDALQERADEMLVYQAAWVIAVAQGVETAKSQGKSRRAMARPPAAVSAHSDAWWHGVSICEQGGRNDPYYGYLSYMDGSAGGKSWAEQVAMGNRTIARYGEDMMYGGAWAHACVLAGYRAAPGG